ncbi:hypothetical protein QWJ26_16055 [Streptomyces sp. CSDS2]|uniref:hypothetical protein n=1 Tax=Streptomyces sp. CSDS2 TaxID=3055051 RepID=UPI0025B0D28F|nr:hypothetical protein [Streptomyces sp. CSDS2]MDN3261302.1 hypothetical protein [Streptomyces sp. CSDS2]
MIEESDSPLEVFRLVPPFGDRYLGLLIDGGPVIRWELDSEANELPPVICGERHGNAKGVAAEYPSGHPFAPVLSRRLTEATRSRFQDFGHYIPVTAPGLQPGDYSAYVPTMVADCLDRDASSSPNAAGEIERAVFVPEELPLDAPCFRLTDNKTYVYWNGWAARLIRSLVGAENIELRLVWSSDPQATPHPRPMGF